MPRRRRRRREAEEELAMDAMRAHGLRRPALAAGLALAVAALGGCREIEPETSVGYQPAKLQELKGEHGGTLVTFTAEAARRTGLKTAVVGPSGDGMVVVPHAALIYDAQGKTYVYTCPKALTFLRREVRVDRVEGGRALLGAGPRAGTRVVTVGAAEVYGTELDVAGSH
jgi:hypothetical protein